MKIHIIVFCQLAPKGAAPPPQWASITAASWVMSTSELKHEQQEEQVDPQGPQEVPIGREQPQAVLARQVGHSPQAMGDRHEPTEPAQEVQRMHPGEHVEEG